MAKDKKLFQYMVKLWAGAEEVDEFKTNSTPTYTECETGGDNCWYCEDTTGREIWFTLPFTCQRIEV